MAFNSATTLQQAQALSRRLPTLPSMFSDPHTKLTRYACSLRPFHWRARAANVGPLMASSLLVQQSASSSEDSMQVQDQTKHLIAQIHDELESFISGEQRNNQSIFEGLLTIDLIERLGISRHFTPQIKAFLNSVYREWREETGLGSPEATVLAFRLLRLNGYHVSSEVLESFKDDRGEFSCFSIATPRGVSTMLNLYRCSQIAFPCESAIMVNAKNSAETQLRRALLDNDLGALGPNNLKIEIKFALDYPRQCLLPRLESRSIVKQLWPGDEQNRKYLELAKLDLEAIQKLQQKEIEELLQWYSEVGINDLKFVRREVVKSYFTVAAAIFEPEFSFFRVAYTKFGCLSAFLDDIYDLESGKPEDLKRFTNALKSWDPSLLDGLPHYMIVAYNALNNTILEMAEESSRVQGRDMLSSIQQNWEEVATVFLKEAEWRLNRQIPSFDEYLEVASPSITGTACTLSPVFLIGKVISGEMLSKIGRGSRFLYLVDCTSRLSNDVVTFKAEQDRGEVTSAVSCYMKGNPDCTQEEAVIYVQNFIEQALQELELELFKSRETVPECCSRVIINFARTMNLIYRKSDGFTAHDDQDLEYLVKDYLYYPLP